MDKNSTRALVRATKAFEERVRYWHGKGLTLAEAEIRAEIKIDHVSKPRIPRRIPKKRIPIIPQSLAIRGSMESEDSEVPEPTQQQVNDVMERLIGSGQATLLNESGQIIPFKRRSKQSQTSVSFNRDELKTLLNLGFPAIVVLVSSSLLIAATVKAFGYTIEGFAMSILLEIGILTLGVSSAKSLYSLFAMRGAALALALLSFLLLHNNAKKALQFEIASMTSTDGRVASLESIGKSLEKKLDELPSTYTTGRDRIVEALNSNIEKISAARAAAAKNSDVETLQQSFEVNHFTRLALLLLNVFFAHRFVAQLKEEGI